MNPWLIISLWLALPIGAALVTRWIERRQQ
jgi:hypothetical protein